MFIKFCSPALNFDSLAKAMVAKRRITTRVEVLIVDFNLLFNNKIFIYIIKNKNN